MHIEAYERLMMDVTKFDIDDVITTSGEGGSSDGPPAFDPKNPWEMPVGV